MAGLKKPFANLDAMKAGYEASKVAKARHHHSQQRGNEMKPGNPWDHTLEQARAQADMGTPPSYDELISRMLADARKDMGR